MSVKVKICGLTNAPDAQAAVAAGADLVGFIFADASPRKLTVPDAAEIAQHIPLHVLKVGVFVNPTEELVLEALQECGLGMLQFHGDEPADFCTQFGVMSLKAFRMRDASILATLPNFPTDAWLLDTYSAKQAGGTGQTFNWDLAIAVKKFGRPIFLAGGLTPENVVDAVRTVEPFAVDVSSGVEISPGKKDHAKITAFINAVKQVSS
jgi:phosphoribosylanthranilate isomerase